MAKSDKYTARPLTAAELTTWDAFTEQSPTGTIFNDSRWLAINAGLFPGNTVEVYGLFSGTELIGGLAAYVRKRGPLKTVAAPIMSFYHCPTLRDDPGWSSYRRAVNLKAQLDALLPDLESRFDALAFNLEPGLTDIRPFLWRGWQATVSYTYRLTLDSEANIWQRFSQTIRQDVLKAEKAGLTVEPCQDLSGIGRLHDLTFRRQNLAPPIAPELLIRLLEQTPAQLPTLCLGLFTPEKALLAVNVALLDSKRAYILLSATAAEGPYPRAAALLRWQLFRQLRQLTAEVDLTGADIPAIANHKSAFGGQLIPYFRVKKRTSLKGKVAMRLYEWLV